MNIKCASIAVHLRPRGEYFVLRVGITFAGKWLSFASCNIVYFILLLGKLQSMFKRNSLPENELLKVSYASFT